MREQAKQVLQKLYLDGVASALLQSSRRILWHSTRKFGRTDTGIIERYLNSHKMRKLHIGCGNHLLDGWLNANLFPQSAIVLHLDATEPFPFCDEEFDYVFSEHMIEHISYAQGLHMLSECYRILRKNGKIRISTPNLVFLIDLYKESKSGLQHEYIKWATDEFIDCAPGYTDTFVINNFVRDWGHRFIYDEKVISTSLEKAGFARIIRCELGESEDEVLRNLENIERMPEGFLRLETMTFEATKLPASRQLAASAIPLRSIATGDLDR